MREVLGMMRRTFARLDVSSRSMYAVVEPGSCFAGTLLELALAADRVYMLDDAGGISPLVRNEFWRAAHGERPFPAGGALLSGPDPDRRTCAPASDSRFRRSERSKRVW